MTSDCKTGRAVISTSKQAEIVLTADHLADGRRLQDFHLLDLVDIALTGCGFKVNLVADFQLVQAAEMVHEIVPGHSPVPVFCRPCITRRRYFQLAEAPLAGYRQSQT